MRGAQFVPLGILHYLLINHAFKLHIHVFHEEGKRFTLLSASPSFLRVIRLVAKKHALSEEQRYVFDSLLKYKLTRDNTFALIRSYDNAVYKGEKSKEDTSEP